MMLDENRSLEPYSSAPPRRAPSLRLKVNRALSHVYRRGELEAIYGRGYRHLGKPPALLTALYLLNVMQS